MFAHCTLTTCPRSASIDRGLSSSPTAAIRTSACIACCAQEQAVRFQALPPCHLPPANPPIRGEEGWKCPPALSRSPAIEEITDSATTQSTAHGARGLCRHLSFLLLLLLFALCGRRALPALTGAPEPQDAHANAHAHGHPPQPSPAFAVERAPANSPGPRVAGSIVLERP